MRLLNWRRRFTNWLSKYGGNAKPSELEIAYRAGWKAALKYRKQ